MTKKCGKCHLIKSDDEFYPQRAALHPDCKECVKAYNRERYKRPDVRQRVAEYRERNAERLRETSKRSGRAYYAKVKGRAKTLWRGAFRRAEWKYEVFGLRLETVEKWLRDGVCPVTGYRFVLESDGNAKTKHPLSPSLDRIDVNKPYSDANARLVIWAYNMFKGQMTDEQCLEICKAIVGKACT